GHGESPARPRQRDPLAVPVDEVALAVRRTLPRREPLADDRAHLARHLGGRIGHREVLAHHAAKLRGDLVHDVVAHGLRRLSGRRIGGRAKEEERGEEDGRDKGHGGIAWGRGRWRVLWDTSSVTGTTCLDGMGCW